MIQYQYAELYKQDNVDKQLTVSCDGVVITNADLHSENMELTESLCSETELRFGCCEASSLKLKISNVFTPLKDKWLTVTEVLNGNTDAPFLFGKYKVYSDVPTADRSFRDVTAYDAMFDIVNAEVSAWYNTLKFPMTVKQFRTSFVSYMGIEQENVVLINDSVSLKKTIQPEQLSGKDVLTAICELNGCFGHIGRNGKLCYVFLPKHIQGLYPANDLYPEDTLYPRKLGTEKIDKTFYITCEYEDYICQGIDKLQIRQEENDIGAIAGNGDNCYIIENNFLVYGMNAQELGTTANNLLSVISDVSYRPFSAKCLGNPCFEVGDAVRLITKYEIVESYILKRTLKGIQAIRDVYETDGEEFYAEKINSVNRSIIQLKGKTNVLVRNVDELQSTITDMDEGLQTQITQTAEKITMEVKKTYETKTDAANTENELRSSIKATAEGINLEVSKKVGKTEIISSINQSAEAVNINASKINLNGAVTANERFVIDTDGAMRAKDGEFEGTVKSKSVTVSGGYLDIYGNFHSPSGTAPSQISFRPASTPGYENAILNYKGLMFFTAGLTGSTSVELLAERDLIFYTGANKETWGTWIDENGVWTQALAVAGTKSRISKTRDYGKRLLYCYEMPSPIFGDIGHGVIGADGLCYVNLDIIFFETIDAHHEYYVFLQSYSDKPIYVCQKEYGYFIVKGEPGTDFDWEIKAKQADFPLYRLEEYAEQETIETFDYVQSAQDYLENFEKEILNYG